MYTYLPIEILGLTQQQITIPLKTRRIALPKSAIEMICQSLNSFALFVGSALSMSVVGTSVVDSGRCREKE